MTEMTSDQWKSLCQRLDRLAKRRRFIHISTPLTVPVRSKSTGRRIGFTYRLTPEQRYAKLSRRKWYRALHNLTEEPRA